MDGTFDDISVLHVEDDSDFANLTADMLEAIEDGLSVESVPNVSTGLDLLAIDEEKYDCIVSDHDMPGRNGIEFLEKVRERDGDIPFILFTGKGSEEIASEAISAGVTDYLQKSGGRDQYEILAKRIRNNVERTRAERGREYMRERMELALESTDSMIFEIDLQTDTVMRHGHFEHFFDFSPEEAPTWRDQLIQGVHPEDRDQFERFYQGIVSGERDYGRLEYRTNSDEGSVRWLRDTIAVEEDQDRALGLAQDITEDKAREKEREQIIARVTDAIVEVDADWRFTLVNDRAEELYDMYESDLLGQDFWDVFLEARDTRFEEEYRRVMETRDSTAFVEYFTGLGGWFDVRVYPNDNGGLSFYFREVGNQLDNEHGFEEQRLINCALGSLNDVLYVVDPDGEFCWWNDRVPEVTGYPEEDLVTMQAIDLFPEDEMDRISVAIDETISTGSAVVEADLLTADGTRIPYEFTGDKVTDEEGTVLGLIGTGRDISERRERENRLKALNETGQELMAAENRDEVFEIGVSSACDILGLDANGICLYNEDRDELVPVAHTEAALELIPNPPPTLGRDSIAWQVFKQGEPRAIDEVVNDPDVYNPDTALQSELFLPINEYGILIASSAAAHAYDEQDVILGSILAETIAAALGHIESLEQLSEQKQELVSQNQRLDEFTGMVSHDLRNPVSIASANLNLYRETGDGAKLDAVERSLQRIEDLTEDLLAVAQTGGQTDDYDIVSVDDVATKAWEMIDTQSASLETYGVTVTGDAGQLQALFENLFRNAVGHGGESVTVRVGPLDDGFYVEDTGDGITDDEREQVFEHGYSTGYGGSGVGLTIVSRIAQAHGWNVTLSESEEGGARFEFEV